MMRASSKILKSSDSHPHSIFVSGASAVIVAGVILCGSAPSAWAQAPNPVIIRVEEDWELSIASPDPAADAPQVVCVFGPDDPDLGTHAVYEMNHGTLPQFDAGGMQLQCWWDDYVITYRNHPNFSECDPAIDLVTFTAVTEVFNGNLNLEIINGDSVTWGTFGGQGYLKLSLTTSRTNLNTYNANHSIEHTRVSFGANRVNRLVRREVRYYSANGLESTDTEDQYVHQLEIDLPEE